MNTAADEANMAATPKATAAVWNSKPEHNPRVTSVNYESTLPWLQINDELPKHGGTLLESLQDPRSYKSN